MNRMSFGSRLKEKREELGLKQSELGKMLGITGAAIGNYENGISSPKADILYRVFDVLKCDANYLFQDEMRGLHSDILTIQETQTLKKYRTLDGYGKQAVDAVLNIEHTRCSENIVVIPDTAIAARGGILAPRGPVDEEAFQRDIANLRDEDEPDL